jgi:hypothetical protein
MNYYDLMQRNANRGHGQYESAHQCQQLGISYDDNQLVYQYLRLNQNKVALRMSRVARRLSPVNLATHKSIAGHAKAIALTENGLMLIPRRDYKSCTTEAIPYQPMVHIKSRLLELRETYMKQKLGRVMDIRQWCTKKIEIIKDYSQFSLHFRQEYQWRRSTRYLYLYAPSEFFELSFHGDHEYCVVRLHSQFEHDDLKIYETDAMTRETISQGQPPQRRFFAQLGDLIGSGVTLEKAKRSIYLKNANAIRKALADY